MMEWYMNTGSGQDPFNLFSLTFALRRFNGRFPGVRLIRLLLSPATDHLLRGVSINDNFSREDHDWLPESVTLAPPKDIFRSLQEFRNQGYPYRDHPVVAPVLHILGEHDRLVPWKSVVEGTSIQSRHAGFWVIVVKDTSHVDLVGAIPIQAYRDIMLAFVQDPKDTLQNGNRCSELLAEARLGAS
jgi:hypothetical protein